MTAGQVASRVLLGFVIFTVGYGIGQEVGQRRVPAVEPQTRPAPGSELRVVVSYFHAPFRCVTCNTIERLAGETVTGRFAEALQAGRVAWRTVDFQAEEDLARHYGVSTSCVVVAGRQDGEETGFERLDEVWDLVNDPPAFSDLVADSIHRYLGEADPP